MDQVNNTKGTVEREGETPTARPRDKIDGDGQTRDAGNADV